MLVKKKYGSLRMWIDYRQLNNKPRKDVFPIPRIEESLALTGAHWFSTMDLTSRYNQVPVAETDWPKIAFCTPFGLFKWNRMPFGICNTRSTFHGLMEWILGTNNANPCCFIWMKSWFFSSTVEQHLKRLEETQGQLQQEGLKAKLSKCAFFQQEVRYLGHVISDKGVYTDPSKVEVATNWQPPTTISELRSFLLCQLLLLICGRFCQVGCPSTQAGGLVGRHKVEEEVRECSCWELVRGVSQQF